VEHWRTWSGHVWPEELQSSSAMAPQFLQLQPLGASPFRSISWRVSQIAESRVPHELWRIFRIQEKCHPRVIMTESSFAESISFCHLSVTQNVTRYVTRLSLSPVLLLSLVL
jgi:hypothetical protein